MRVAGRFLLSLLLLVAFAGAEPRALYSELFATLRGAENDLGRIERKIDRVKELTIKDWDETTRALTRLDSVWAGCQTKLDGAKPPKHQKQWAKVQEMLTSQRELAMKSVYAVQLRYQLGDPSGPPAGVSKATLDAVKKELPALRARYDKATTEAAREL